MLCGVLLSASLGDAAQVAQTAVPENATSSSALRKQIQRSYLELFREAASFEFTPAEIQTMRTHVKQAQDSCVKEFKHRCDQLNSQLSKVQRQLKEDSAKLSESQRHDLHCRIQELRVLSEQSDVLADHAIPVAYQNRLAKLDVIEKWPAQVRQIRQLIADASYHS